MANYGIDYSRFQEERDGSYYYKWYVENVIGSTSDAVSMAYQALIDSATWGDENYFFFVEHVLSAFYPRDTNYLRRLVKKRDFDTLIAQYKGRFSKKVPVLTTK